MPELSGAIQTIEWARWLWLIPFFPLLGGLVNAIYCSGLSHQVAHAIRGWFADEDKPAPAPSPRTIASEKAVARVAMMSLALSLAAAVVHVVALADRPPSGRFFFQHLWQMVRVGQLDAGFDFAMDPLGAAMVLLVSAMGLLVCVYATTFMAGAAGYWRFFAWFGVLVAAMLTLVLSDNLLMLFIGWEATSLAALGLLGLSLSDGSAVGVRAGIKTFLLHRLGDAGLLLGVAVLFWGLGGRWMDDGTYQPDLDPRIAAVNVTSDGAPLSPDDPSLKGGQGTRGRGFLTVTALPGSLVYLDDSHTPLLAADGLPIHTPFVRYPLAGAVHSFRIAPDDTFRLTEGGSHAAFVVEGGVLPNYTVQHIPFGGDREVALVLFGPTLTFREMRDQLAVSDAKGSHPVRASLRQRRGWGGLGLLTLAGLLVFVGASGKSGLFPFHRWFADAMTGLTPASGILQAGAVATAGVYLAARLGFLFAESATSCMVVVLGGLTTSIGAAILGLRQSDLRRVVAYATLSQTGLMFVALGAGACDAGIFHLVTSAVCCGGLLLAAGLVGAPPKGGEPATPDRRTLAEVHLLAASMPNTAWAYMVGCLALTAVPIPLLAGFWSAGDCLAKVFASTLIPWPLAKLTYVALIGSSALTAFYLWRSYYLVFGGPKPPAVDKRFREPRAVRALWWIGGLSIVAGAVLGFGPSTLGGSGSPLLESWLAPAYGAVASLPAELPLVVRYGLVGLAFAAAYGGWAVARRRHGAGATLAWTVRKAAVLSLGALLLLWGREAAAQPPAGHTPRHFPHSASTPPPSQAGPAKMSVTLEDGTPGPLVLKAQNGGYVGHFVVHNDGPGQLTVSRIAMRGDDDDPRLPPRFSARFADGGGGSGVVAAHSSKRVSVTWIPDREPKMRQALGHVILTSNDERAGEVAIGFIVHAESPLGFVIEHLLTLLIVLPLLGGLVALAMRIVGYEESDRIRHVTLALAIAECLLAIVLYEGFRGAVTRGDGNDGYQFVERAASMRSLGSEYFVGVDGTSASVVVLTAIVGLAAAIASYRVDQRLRTYYGLHGLLVASLMGLFVSLDLFMFYGFWIAILVALYLLARGWGGAEGPRAARKLAMLAAPASLLLLVAFIALASNSDPNFLIDGTRVSHSSAIPELMRVSYNAKHLVLFGMPFVKVVWVLLFLGFGVLLAVVPLHGWLPAILAGTATPVSILVAGAGLNAGVYGLIRVAVGVLPDGARWAATTVVALGALSVAYGAVRALFEEDLKRLLAYATISQMGFCLVGIGAMTREGIAAAIIQMVSHGIIASMLFILAGALEDRGRTRDVARFGGLVVDVPLLTAVAGFAFVASLGLPGLSGFWGEALAILGVFPAHRLLAAFVAMALIVSAAYHLRTFQRLFLGAMIPSWRKDPALQPFGGKFPELSQRDLAALLPLIVLCLCLGFNPGPFFTMIQGAVADLNQLVNPPGPDEVGSIDGTTTGRSS